MANHNNNQTYFQARIDLFEFIEIWYNRQRQHSHLRSRGLILCQGKDSRSIIVVDFRARVKIDSFADLWLHNADMGDVIIK